MAQVTDKPEVRVLSASPLLRTGMVAILSHSQPKKVTTLRIV